MKMEKRDACAVTYFGDGGTSEVRILKNLAVLEFVASNNTSVDFLGDK